MPGAVLLDTSAYAHFRRGQRDVVDMLTNAEKVYLSAVTVGELEAGSSSGRGQKRIGPTSASSFPSPSSPS